MQAQVGVFGGLSGMNRVLWVCCQVGTVDLQLRAGVFAGALADFFEAVVVDKEYEGEVDYQVFGGVPGFLADQGVLRLRRDGWPVAFRWRVK